MPPQALSYTLWLSYDRVNVLQPGRGGEADRCSRRPCGADVSPGSNEGLRRVGVDKRGTFVLLSVHMFWWSGDRSGSHDDRNLLRRVLVYGGRRLPALAVLDRKSRARTPSGRTPGP